MPAERKTVKTIKELEMTAIEAVAENRRVTTEMIGSIDPHTGESWCSDCREAKPVIEKCLANTKDTDLFLSIEVGTRDEWKTPENPFRNYPLFQLHEIPTLFRFGLVGDRLIITAKLVGDECKNSDRVTDLLIGN